jgi:hypothetical protein
MPPEESPEAKFDRLKKLLQDSILRDYPNPERKGCPGGVIVQELAERPLDQSIEDDPHWNHITHCSECYREFLVFNEASRRRARTRKAVVGWGLALGAAVIAIAALLGVRQSTIFPKRPQNAELVYAKRTIVIPSMERSGNVDEEKPLFLERLPLELTIQLPVGSRAGTYELQLKRDDRTVLLTGGNAEINHGITAFTVRKDLSSVEPGRYSMEVRQVPHDWNLYPVVIR